MNTAFRGHSVSLHAPRAVVVIGLVAMLAGASVAMPSAAAAQENVPPGQSKRVRPPMSAERREQLEREFRERGEQVVREKLNLSNDQMTKLRQVNQKFAPRHRALFQQERDIREALRGEVDRGNSADQGRVKQLMDQASQVRKQRFDLMQDEQKELGAFLTPVQQAQYQGLQMQLRRKVQEMRERRGGPPGARGWGDAGPDGGNGPGPFGH